ncbi:MAG: hypothetical protein LUG98_02075 [Tannerellaceae bacterium]|nr:hypothetical protein [Tannerellaceae bacterium]
MKFMYRISQQTIISFESDTLSDNDDISIWYSFIESLDLSFRVHKGKVEIRNCVIENLYLFNGWFPEGFVFEGNIVKNWVLCEIGPHNKKPFIMRNNIFHGFFHFFDCVFSGEVLIENNIFMQGSDLLGNQQTSTKTLFQVLPVIRNNQGRLDFNYDKLKELQLTNKYLRIL